MDNHIQKEPELRKDLGLVAALSLVVGMVLGAGAFMKPPAVLAAAGDSSTALLAWAGLQETVQVDFAARREADLDRLADSVEAALDWEKLAAILPAGAPVSRRDESV